MKININNKIKISRHIKTYNLSNEGFEYNFCQFETLSINQNVVVVQASVVFCFLKKTYAIVQNTYSYTEIYI